MGRVSPSAQTLPGIDAHPHARAVLLAVLPCDEQGSSGGGASGPGAGGGGRRGDRAPRAPSHAYLFHGPPGAGKRTVARAFAGALLAEGSPAPQAARERVARGAHPDLTWVTPSGAGEMLVSDIDHAVVAAAAHTPFESRRRVFVLEDAHTLNDQAANRLLKTLEEPPPFAHLLLLAPSTREVLPTIASRCQQVRFDPLPSARIEERLREQHPAGEAQRLAACARLALGDARLAGRLAGDWGGALRERVEGFVRGALGDEAAGGAAGGSGAAGAGGAAGGSGPAGTAGTGGAAGAAGAGGAGRSGPGGAGGSLEALLRVARDAGTGAGEELAARVAQELELLPAKERKRHEREATEAQRRSERRARTAALDLALRLAQLWLRDLWCVAEGAGELVYAVDRRSELERDAAGRSPARLRAAVELVQDTRLRLPLNVSEELALEALAHRLQTLLAAAA